MESAVSLQHLDAGSIPSSIQWVKRSHTAAAVKYVATVAGIWSPALELPYAAGLPPCKKKKKNSALWRNTNRQPINSFIFVSLLHTLMWVDHEGASVLVQVLQNFYQWRECWSEESTLNCLLFGFWRNCGETIFQKITNLENAEDSLFPISMFLINQNPKVMWGAQSSRPRSVTHQLLNLEQSFYPIWASLSSSVMWLLAQTSIFLNISDGKWKPWFWVEYDKSFSVYEGIHQTPYVLDLPILFL